jgi:hypothetical protein
MMALSAQQWNQISKRSGVPVRVIKLLVNVGERSGVDATSPMGAHGRAQLMPDTARRLSKTYGINTNTEYGNVLGGALYLGEQKRKFKHWNLAFAAYNAGPGAVQKYGGIPPYRETRDYVRRLMGALGAAPSEGPGDLPGSQTSTGGAVSPGSPDLASLAREHISEIAAGDFKPTESFQETVDAIRSASSQLQAGVPGAGSTPATPGAPQIKTKGKWQKYVTLASGADRKGVHTQEPVLQFVGMLGLNLGRKLTITTGTNHNQMTVNGNVSAHWDGHAGDIAMSGKALTAAGRRALILAGMDPREAAKVKGGLFNIGGYQIIFNTNEGGNHWNHLHVGIRG